MSEMQTELAGNEVLSEQDSFPAGMPTHEQFLQTLGRLETKTDAQGEVAIQRGTDGAVYKLKPEYIRATEKILSVAAGEYKGYVSAQWWSWLLQVRTLTFFPPQRYIDHELARMHGCKNKYPAFRPAQLLTQPNHFKGLQNYFPEVDFIISMGTEEYFTNRVGKASRREDNGLLPVIQSSSVVDLRTFCEKAFVEIGGVRQMDPALITYIKKYCLENFDTLRFEGLPEAMDYFDQVVDQWCTQLNVSFASLSSERPSINRSAWNVQEFFTALKEDPRWFLRFNAADQSYVVDQCLVYLREHALGIPDAQMRMMHESLSLVREDPNFIRESYRNAVSLLVAGNFTATATPIGLKEMPTVARPIFLEELQQEVRRRMSSDADLREKFVGCKERDIAAILGLPGKWDTKNILSAIGDLRSGLQQ